MKFGFICSQCCSQQQLGWSAQIVGVKYDEQTRNTQLWWLLANSSTPITLAGCVYPVIALVRGKHLSIIWACGKREGKWKTDKASPNKQEQLNLFSSFGLRLIGQNWLAQRHHECARCLAKENEPEWIKPKTCLFNLSLCHGNGLNTNTKWDFWSSK